MLSHVSLEAPAGNVVTLHDTAQLAAGALRAALVTADGLVGIPAVRAQLVDKVEDHGQRDHSRFVGGRGPTLEGELWGPDHAAAWQLHDDLEHALWSTLVQPGVLRYRRQGVGQPLLRARVKLAGYENPLAGAAKLLRYQLQLSQPDPRAYTDPPAVVVSDGLSAGGGGLMFPFVFPIVFTTSSGGVAEVVNAGSAPAPVVFRIYGRAVAPVVRLLETGDEVALRGEVGAGTFVEVDTGGPSVRLAGDPLQSLGSQVLAAQTTFFRVPARSTVHLQLLASEWDAAARLEVDVSSAYGG